MNISLCVSGYIGAGHSQTTEGECIFRLADEFAFEVDGIMMLRPDFGVRAEIRPE